MATYSIPIEANVNAGNPRCAITFFSLRLPVGISRRVQGNYTVTCAR